jgi:hypothetical protein
MNTPKDDNDWGNCKIKSLREIPMMLKNGFKLEFSYKDEMYKRTTTLNPPLFGVNFVKGDLVVWKIKQGYQTAYLKNGGYRDHQPFKTLVEVIENK